MGWDGMGWDKGYVKYLDMREKNTTQQQIVESYVAIAANQD